MTGPTILWISSGPSRYQEWQSVFDKTDTQVLRVDELNLSLCQVEETEIDVVLMDASGLVQDDIDQCRRLRERFDCPLILITTNSTEEFAVAAYAAGIDECISSHISPDLLRVKVDARILLIKRITQRRKLPSSAITFIHDHAVEQLKSHKMM